MHLLRARVAPPDHRCLPVGHRSRTGGSRRDRPTLPGHDRANASRLDRVCFSRPNRDVEQLAAIAFACLDSAERTIALATTRSSVSATARRCAVSSAGRTLIRSAPSPESADGLRSPASRNRWCGGEREVGDERSAGSASMSRAWWRLCCSFCAVLMLCGEGRGRGRLVDEPSARFVVAGIRAEEAFVRAG